MPTEPPEHQNSDADPHSLHPNDPDASKLKPPLERSRFGGTAPRHARDDDDDAPVSRSDLSKGQQELLEYPTAHISWGVLIISSIIILAFSVWAIFLPDDARQDAVVWTMFHYGVADWSM